MSITQQKMGVSPWLLLVFTLPSNKASERVGIWRKLQKFGSIQLRNAGYMLPNNPVNQERFEWLATARTGNRHRCRGLGHGGAAVSFGVSSASSRGVGERRSLI